MKKRTITEFVATQPYAKHLYSRWYQLKGRCYYQSDSRYSQYGGKGIEMCEEWKLNFFAFYEWCISHGYEKEKCLIRMDKKGHYEPSNCQWVTRSVSSKLIPKRKRVEKNLTIDGETKPLSQWAKQAGINVDYLKKRIKEGVTGRDLLKPKGVYTLFQGKEMPIRDIAKITNIPYITLLQRHKRGVQGEALLTRIQQKKR